jgi:predicted RNA methylase
MNQFHQYIQPFSEQLERVSVEQLRLEEYPAKYLQQLLEHKIYYLHMYAAVLNKAIDEAGCSKEEMIVIDYGCGNGLLGLFAKFCQCKAVYLNDHNASFLNAAKELANALAIKVDEFIDGDIERVETYFSNKIVPTAFIGTDVIEHIYDLETFFTSISRINRKMVTVFTTASVTDNYFKSKQLIKLQYKDEHVGSNALHADANDTFAGLAFRKIREQLIKNYAQGLHEEQVLNLSKATRGLDKQDILKAVDEFKLSGTLPKPPVHATNTCDPITSSWTERLLTINEYKQLYKQAGFTLKVYNGFYNEWQGGVKAMGLRMANRVINLLHERGRSVTPFIILVGGAK